MTRLIKLAASSIIIAIAVAGIATAIALSIYYLSAYTAQYTAIERFPGPDAISVQMLGAAGDIVVDNRAGYSFKAVFMVYAYNGSSSPGAYFGRSISIAPGTNIVRITDIVPPGFTPDFKRSYMVIGRLAIPIAGGLSSSQPPQDQGVSESRYVANSYSFGSKTIGDVRISQYWSSLSISSPNYKVEGSYPRRTSFCDLLTREITRREGTRATGDLYSAYCGWCCLQWGTCCYVYKGVTYCYTCCTWWGNTPYSYSTGQRPYTTPAVSDYRGYFCTNYYFGYYNDVLASVSGSYSSQDISIAVIRGAEWGQGDERRGYQYPSTYSNSYLVVTGDIIPVENTRYTWEWWNYWVKTKTVTYTVAFGGCPNCVSVDRTATIYEEYSTKIASEIRYGCEGYNYGATDCKRVMRIDDMGSNISYSFYPTPDGRAEGVVNISIKARVTLENDPKAFGDSIRIPVSLAFDIIGGRAIYEVSLPKLPRPPLLYGGGSIAIYPTSITAYINNERMDIYFSIWSSDLNKGYVSLNPVSLTQGNIETYTGSINLGTASLRMNTVIDVPRSKITTCWQTLICWCWWCWWCWTTTCASAANIEINITLKITITPIAELRSQ
ncbi:MAG: hypothetical protein QXQ96_10235 [Sulfolobales archaeon]